MLQGLYMAANGMMTVEARQAVTANNIANAATDGFKSQLAVQQGYYAPYSPNGSPAHLFDTLRAPGGGDKLTETYTNYTTGSLVQTGRELDVALLGPGFLQVEKDGETFLTRAGHLSLDADSTIVNPDGYPVLDDSGGTITVPPGDLAIGEDGAVSVDGDVIGQLGIVEVADPHALQRAGYTLFALGGATTGPALETSLISGTREGSNVQIPIEMIQMTMGLRAYGANQQVITSISETVGRLIDQIGAPG